MQRRTLLKAFALSASVVAMGMSFGAQAADTIKVGIDRYSRCSYSGCKYASFQAQTI